LSFLPLAAAWFCLRRAIDISALAFLMPLAAGLLSLALAAVAQSILPQVEYSSIRGVLILSALRTALIEEGSRFIMLTLLFTPARFFRTAENSESLSVSAGMIAGLAFASVETASFAAANPMSAPVRLIGAVLLHAACGMRCALAASAVFSRKLSGILKFLSAVSIHAVYNLVTTRGGFFTVLAILLAISSFASSLRYISYKKNSGASGR
jgi:hypothetical protein